MPFLLLTLLICSMATDPRCPAGSSWLVPPNAGKFSWKTNTKSVGVTTPWMVDISADKSFALMLDNHGHKVVHADIATGTAKILAGSGTAGSKDGKGTNAEFKGPMGVAISHDMTFALVANNNGIRRIDLSNDEVTTLAGTAVISNAAGVALSRDMTFALASSWATNKVYRIDLGTGDVTVLAGGGAQGAIDGKGTAAGFVSPSGLRISPDMKFALIADTWGNVVRRIDLTTTEVTTVAGSGAAGNSDGKGTAAILNKPFDVPISEDMSFALVADGYNDRIRKIDLSTGEVTSVACTIGKFNKPYGVALASDASFALASGSHDGQLSRFQLAGYCKADPTKAPTLAPTRAPTEVPTTTPTPTPTNSPTPSPTKAPTLPTKAPTKSPTKSPTTHFAGQYRTGIVSDNMANLKTNTKAGDSTAIALVSVSLVFILLMMGVLIFLVIKVKELTDSVKRNSGGSAGPLTSKQQARSVV